MQLKKQIKKINKGFNSLMDFCGTKENAKGEKYTPYSCRHFYATQRLLKKTPVIDVALNAFCARLDSVSCAGQDRACQTICVQLQGRTQYARIVCFRQHNRTLTCARFCAQLLHQFHV